MFLCLEMNLAQQRISSLQSNTFGQQTSDLAADGDTDTCAVIDRWQHYAVGHVEGGENDGNIFSPGQSSSGGGS